ncbi:MAG: sugar transferase [Candidatus Omnitrophota bacterium]
MKYSYTKLPNLFRKTIVFLLFVVTFLLVGPSLRDSLTYAVTYFDNPKISSEHLELPYLSEPISPAPPVRQKSHAPEPSSLFLILGGMGTMIVRFAQKSFQKFKRAFDVILSLVGLTIASPVILLSAFLIRANSKGPIIYKQNRVGRNGKIFKIYKLRTMRLDAEKDTGAVWAKKDDPRVTSVGRILRQLHIDEIPQLLNVLKGEMSIVGPRPERPELVRDLKVLIRDYEKRLLIKPGITGLAQVWHKYDETIDDVKKKIKYDILYLKKMCWLVDLRILMQTVVVVLTGRGAR